MKVLPDVLEARALLLAYLILCLLPHRHLATFSFYKAIKYWIIIIPIDTVNFVFLGKHRFVPFKLYLLHN